MEKHDIYKELHHEMYYWDREKILKHLNEGKPIPEWVIRQNYPYLDEEEKRFRSYDELSPYEQMEIDREKSLSQMSEEDYQEQMKPIHKEVERRYAERHKTKD